MSACVGPPPSCCNPRPTSLLTQCSTKGWEAPVALLTSRLRSPLQTGQYGRRLHGSPACSCLHCTPSCHQHQLLIQNKLSLLCCCNPRGADPSVNIKLGFEALHPAVLLLHFLPLPQTRTILLAVVLRSSKPSSKYLNTCVLWW